MSNECRDCTQVINLKDNIKSLWNAVNEIKDNAKDFEKRITDLEITKGENRKDFDRIFEAIEGIKKSIDKIATAIDVIQNKSAKTYENLKFEILKYAIIAGVATIIAKFV